MKIKVKVAEKRHETVKINTPFIKLDAFLKYIEEHTDNTMNVFIMRQYGCVFVVRPKNTILI